MEFITKEPARARLTDASAEWNGHTVSWTNNGGDGLTEADKQALRRKHESRNVNYARAAEVKRMMNDGMRCMEIANALHRKYGRTMVKRDHAALSGRGGAKKRR